MRLASVAVLALAVFAGLAVRSPSAQQQPSPEPLFIVHFSLGEAWDASKPAHEQAHFAEHSARLAALRQEGRLKLGARYGDKGLLVLAGGELDAVRDELSQDPMVQNGLFALDVQVLRPFYPGCVGTP